MRIVSILALLAALSLASCARKSGGVLPVDVTLQEMVPSDTIRLYGGSVEAMRRTPVYEKYLAKRSLPMLDRFVAESGIYPRADLRDFLVADNGVGTVAFVHGDFRRSEIENRLRSEKASRDQYKGVTIWVANEYGVAFLGPHMAVGGNVSLVRQAVDRRGSGASLPPGLATLGGRIPDGCQFWGIMVGPPKELRLPERSNLQNLERAAQSVQTLAIGFDLRRGLKVDAEGSFATGADAKQIHDALKGFVGLGRLSTPDDKPELLRVYDGVEIRLDDARLNIGVNVPFDLLDSLLKSYGFVT